MNKFEEIEELPVLPLRDLVMFPGMVAPLFVGRKGSMAALEKASALQGKNANKIFLLAQKDPEISNPKEEDLYTVGSVAQILKSETLPDNTVKIVVESIVRGCKQSIHTDTLENNEEEFLAIKFVPISTQNQEYNKKILKLLDIVKEEFSECAKISKKIPSEILNKLMELEDPEKLSDTIGMHLTISSELRQKILEEIDIEQRLSLILEMIDMETEAFGTDKKIKNRVRRQMEKTQKEYYLNEQLKAIQKELGDTDDFKSEIKSLESKIKINLASHADAKEKAMNELKKLKSMQQSSSEASVVRGYLDWILSIPWQSNYEFKQDLDESFKILDKSHYGMSKIKDRIIEHLAICKRTKTPGGAVLCFVGPPGVGKTSLASAIAKATQRNYIKISLGGISDESEIRGHRRTYIGAMPGKIIHGMKKSGCTSPLILLDEIDKMASDFRGDPVSALLEVLDPEQNSKFLDHYIDIEYDLSNVMFIATANSIENMSLPLLDRMEIISLSSYTEEEKIQIAKSYIVNKQKEKCGLKKKEFTISEQAIKNIIQLYTREAGLRGLEKFIGKIARKALTEITRQKNVKSICVTNKNLKKYCGPTIYEHNKKESIDSIGVATGLAYTQYGGEILQIETLIACGEEKIKYTGKLGDVMKESVEIANTYVKSLFKKYSINPKLLNGKSIHLHVPEGATPKDGPSAGIAIATSILSAITSIPVRANVAMTGEITLRGSVLEIGGLKEKLLAALRADIDTVIIPAKNEKNIEELPKEVKNRLKIILASNFSEVAEIALNQDLNKKN